MAETTFHSITLPGRDPARVPLTAIEFNPQTNYKVRDYCTYQGILYRCTETHSAGTWDNTKNYFTATNSGTNIGDELNNRLVVPPTTEPASTDRRVGDLWIDPDTDSPVISVDPQPVAGSTNVPQSGGTFNLIKNLDNNKASKSLLTGNFDATKPYSVNQLCIHDGYLYRCKVDIPTGAAWNVSKWQATTIETELARIESEEVDLDVIAETFGDSSSYAVGDYVLHTENGVDKLYRCTNAVSDTSLWNSQYWSEVKLADEVSDLKSALDKLNEYNFEPGNDVELATGAVTNVTIGTNGYATQQSGYTLYRYAVEAGDWIYLDLTADTYTAWQFSNSLTIYGTNRVGETNTNSVKGFVNVPTGASYIAIGHTSVPVVKEMASTIEILDEVKASKPYVHEKIVEANADLIDYSIEIKDFFVDKTTRTNTYVNTAINVNDPTAWYTNNNFTSSNVNEIEPNKTYNVSALRYNNGETQQFCDAIFYDDTYTYISKQQNAKVFTTPSNAKYLILTFYNTSYANPPLGLDDLTNVIVEEGNNPVYPLTDAKLKKIFPYTGYEGKKWMVIGDSITEHNFRAFANYHDYIKNELGIDVINCGVSGSGYKMLDNENKAFYQRIAGYSSYTPDVITVMGGINDIMFSSASIMGEINDTGTNTWFGCAYNLVNNLRTTFPNVPIGIMSPLPEKDYNPNDKTNTEYIFVQKLEEFCDYYCIPFLNQYNKSGFTPWITAFKERFTSCREEQSGDGLHPNMYGHQLIYPRIREFLKTII